MLAITLDVVLALCLAVLLARWTLLVFGSLTHYAASRRLRGGVGGSVAVVIPAFDEEDVIEATVRSVLASVGVDVEVIVIDDGSTDSTAAIVASIADPRVRLLSDGVNRGKPEALNIAFAVCTAPIVVVCDADTRVEADALGRILARFEEPGVAAVSCNVKVGNRDRFLTRLQSIEYISGIHVERRAQALFGCITTVPGALSGWRREVVDAHGGFSADTLTEDADLTITLQKAGHRVVFEPTAVAWTVAPSTWADLFRQRRRWVYGNLQCAFKHLDAFVTSKNLALRVLGLPNFWYVHLFGFLIPLFALPTLPEAVTHITPIGLVWGMVGYVIGDFTVAVIAYIVDRERKAELLWVPVQRLVWVPLLYVVIGAVLVFFVRRQRVPWGKPVAAG